MAFMTKKASTRWETTNETSDSKVTSLRGGSIIAADLRIKGDLESNGQIEILGEVEGDIRAGRLTVGEKAQIKGSIFAQTLRLCGNLVGQIRADTVELSSTASVTGDILHKSLAVEAGGSIEGSVRRLREQKETREVEEVTTVTALQQQG